MERKRVHSSTSSQRLSYVYEEKAKRENATHSDERQVLQLYEEKSHVQRLQITNSLHSRRMYGMPHNVCLNDAWQEKKNEFALLTKTVSPIALLTTPVLISTDTSPLMFETNAIHDNGASVSLCSKEVTDAISLKGENRPLGLSVVGNPNLVQEAFKAMIAIADAHGNHLGNAVVHVVPEFVNLKAVDWTTQSKNFPHLRSINFPTPFKGGQCDLLLGNDNHHLMQQKQPTITAEVNSQASPYAS
jgi:hypothetical protein